MQVSKDNMKLSPREIIQLRNRIGKSQDEFGEILGVSGRHVRRFETGESKPSLSTSKLLKVLWCSDELNENIKLILGVGNEKLKTNK